VVVGIIGGDLAIVLDGLEGVAGAQGLGAQFEQAVQITGGPA
jgi:hypothetical protein